MNRSKKIQKYLDKQMSGQEIADFEQELKINPELYEELLLHKDVDAAIKDLIGENMFLKNLELAHKSYMESTTKKNSAKTPIFQLTPKYLIRYAAAAVIFIALSVGVFYTMSSKSISPDKLYTSYYVPYEVNGANRSGNAGDESLIEKAMQKFEQKDFDGAIKIFNSMKTTGNTNISSNFYKGIAYLEMNKPNEAIKSLEVVVKNENSEVLAEAEWYLGLAYLKANDLDNARKQFTKVSEKYPFYKKKADEIINKIKE